MKTRSKKMMAAALAMCMCMPTAAFAAPQTGDMETSFDVYSPTLHINVPVKADIKINPLADSTAIGVGQFSVASNSIDIVNASVDTVNDTAIPVNVTVKATIGSTAADVVTEYNTFTADKTSTKKRINLMLTEAKTAAVLDEDNRAAQSGDGDQAKLLDFASVPVKTAAVYKGADKTTAITKYGSLLSIDIARPTTDDTTNNSFLDPAKVKPTVGSFAVTGVANANADWKADDIAVKISYVAKASEALEIKTPIVSESEFTSGSSASDLTITVPDVGDAEVMAIGCHNDNAYKDYNWDAAAYTVKYVDNSGKTDAQITLKKDDAGLAFLAGDDYKGKKQDFVVGLTDGRMVVSTLTVK